jgi:glutathione S-transferase
MSAWIAFTTVAALLLYFYMGLAVAGARRKHNIPAPATTGNPEFERIFRVQMNTLEWMPLFLPALWMCAIYWDPRIVAVVGVIWIAGRATYMRGYIRAADQRSMGFLIQSLAVLVLIIGTVVGAIISLVSGPGA